MPIAETVILQAGKKLLNIVFNKERVLKYALGLLVPRNT